MRSSSWPAFGLILGWLLCMSQDMLASWSKPFSEGPRASHCQHIELSIVESAVNTILTPPQFCSNVFLDLSPTTIMGMHKASQQPLPSLYISKLQRKNGFWQLPSSHSCIWHSVGHRSCHGGHSKEWFSEADPMRLMHLQWSQSITSPSVACLLSSMHCSYPTASQGKELPLTPCLVWVLPCSYLLDRL